MSEVKVNKISPRSGTDVTLGDASDTFTIPASATLDVNGTLDLAGSTMTGFTIPSGQTVTVASSGEIDIASGATLDVNGTIDVTGATVTGLSAGKVLQVTEGSTSTPVTNNTTTYVDTGLTASLTTTADNSKVLVIVNQNGLLFLSTSSFTHAVTLTLDEDAGTDRTSYNYLGYGIGAAGYATDARNMTLSFHYLTAAVTSASTTKTFKTKFKKTTASPSCTGAWQYTGASTMILMEIAA